MTDVSRNAGDHHPDNEYKFLQEAEAEIQLG